MNDFINIGTDTRAISRLRDALSGHRTYAVYGDIHSACRSVRTLFDLACTLPIYKLGFCGDYIDRSEPSEFGSVKTIHEVLRIRNQLGGIAAVRGNHEELFLESLEIGLDLAAEDHVDSFFSECKRLREVPKNLIAWIQSLPVLLRLSPHLVLVHGGPSQKYRHLPLNEHPHDSLMWSYHAVAPTAEPDVTIIRGHEFVQNPVEENRVISLDTGVGFGNRLTLGFISDEGDLKHRLLAYAQSTRDGRLTGIFVRDGGMR